MVVIKHTSGVKPKKPVLPTIREIRAAGNHEHGWRAEKKNAPVNHPKECAPTPGDTPSVLD